ncbi:hypothetical protein [Parapedobacter tibetensis]|uniref:hypothetical protein n=1 Tax=Parapedobacter tibetensis TaxID=2972951 RepID=UPI00214D975B|nr:hypothetical protein [Parapedobacter tibetensis]
MIDDGHFGFEEVGTVNYIISFAFPGESYHVSDAGRSVKKESVISDNLRVVSVIVLRATDMENAIELAKDCPILEHGGTVEVREIPSPSVFTSN